MDERIETRFPIRIESDLLWGDMDALGHLNNCMYFRLFETARIAYFGRVSFPWPPEETVRGPILASTFCEFKVPLMYPDRIRTEAGISRLGRSSLTMVYRICRAESNEIAAVGEAVIVHYHYEEEKAIPLPGPLKDRIRGLEVDGS